MNRTSKLFVRLAIHPSQLVMATAGTTGRGDQISGALLLGNGRRVSCEFFHKFWGY
jgi:hypothetical protein